MTTVGPVQISDHNPIQDGAYYKRRNLSKVSAADADTDDRNEKYRPIIAPGHCDEA